MSFKIFHDSPRRRIRYTRLLGAVFTIVVVLLIFGGHDSAHRALQEHRTTPRQFAGDYQEVLGDPNAQSLADDIQQVKGTSGSEAGFRAIPPTLHDSSGLISADHTHTKAFDETSSPIDRNIPTGNPIPAEDPVDHSKPRSRIGATLQKLLEWDPPQFATLHQPSYSKYFERDYDPNRWEGFEKNKEIFLDNTLEKSRQSVPYRPYPDYNSPVWRSQYRGDFASCEGVAGVRYNESEREIAQAYKRKKITADTEPTVGSFDAIGLDGSVCFDRFSRLGPFGQKGATLEIEKADLGQLQNKCLAENSNRYADDRSPDLRPGVQFPPTIGSHSKSAQDHDPNGPSHTNRTAVLIRSWEGYEYQENDVVSIRSLVSELALQSGGEYHVFLFVMLSEGADVNDQKLYDEKLEEIPQELRSMTIFWSEKLVSELYPNVKEYRVNRSQFMPVQWFIETHPEFEFVWNHELDARYIGHHYHFVEKVISFARKQPRKYLWERNARFYFPAAHGSFEAFTNNTNTHISQSPYVTPVWGSQYIAPPEAAGPQPPTTIDQDNFQWGVNEEADFISLLPIWEARRSTWYWKYHMYNYPEIPFTPEKIPVRAYINTHGRYSRRLLHVMHEENLKGRHMTTELWPSTIALHHSLKAVYVPHPIWTTHKWPGVYADAVFNADGWGAGSFVNASEPPDDGLLHDHAHPTWGRGRAYSEERARLTLPQNGTGPNGEGAMARWGQERDSPYNWDREHNFLGWSWYYASDFGRMIYWRWLGWRQSYSIFTMGWTPEYDEFKDIGTAAWEMEHGRLCLPPMLLHPVKRVHQPVIGADGKEHDVGECLKSGC